MKMYEKGIQLLISKRVYTLDDNFCLGTIVVRYTNTYDDRHFLRRVDLNVS